jgi:hypothetical protein
MALPFFAWRSVTLSAFRALQNAQPTVFQRGAEVVQITGPATGITTAIGGNVLNLGYGGAINGFQLLFQGYTNLAPLNGGQKISVLARFAFFTAVGNPAIFNIGGGPAGYFPSQFGFALNGADTRAQISSITGSSIYNSNPYTWTGVTSRIMYDLVVTYDGATTGSNLKTWVNGVNVATVSAGAGPVWDISRMVQVVLGGGLNGLTDTHIAFNEFAIWSEIIDASSVTLSGQGATGLIGPARNIFVAANNFRGEFGVNPGDTQVAFGIPYAVSGVTGTGSFAGSGGGGGPAGSFDVTIGSP